MTIPRALRKGDRFGTKRFDPDKQTVVLQRQIFAGQIWPFHPTRRFVFCIMGIVQYNAGELVGHVRL